MPLLKLLSQFLIGIMEFFESFFRNPVQYWAKLVGVGYSKEQNDVFDKNFPSR
jgi:hypothetical protein